MGLSRSKTLSLLVWLCLLVLALRGDESVERWIERGFVPAQWLARLCSPFAWIASGEVRAAEQAVEARAAERAEIARAALREEQAFALPSIEGLREDRALVPAQFIDTVPGMPDARVIAFAPDAALEVGLPVVCGNTYVGRVSALDPRRRGEATVELVTGDAFRVGAVVSPRAESPAATAGASSNAASAKTDVRLVVGGVERSPEEDQRSLYLAVRVESDRDLSGGLVRVSESDSFGLDPSAKLADQYLLGELVRYTVRGIPTLGVRARLNYQTGLYRAVVLAHAGVNLASVHTARDPLETDDWIESELSTLADPAFWREARRVFAGEADGVVRGSAISAGAEFLGRVNDVGAAASTASLLGDPGLAVHVLAEVEGEASPVVLGALVSLAKDRATQVVFMRWESSVEMAPDAGCTPPLRARLYTGAGEREVPPGLWIGTTELPRSRGVHTLRVELAHDLALVRHVRVWRDPARERASEHKP